MDSELIIKVIIEALKHMILLDFLKLKGAFKEDLHVLYIRYLMQKTFFKTTQ